MVGRSGQRGLMIAEQADNPDDPELKTKFYRQGKVAFVISARETSLLKSLTQDDIRLGMVNRRKGWRSRLVSKYLVVSGIVKTLLLSFYSPRAASVFDFFAIN